MIYEEKRKGGKYQRKGELLGLWVRCVLGYRKPIAGTDIHSSSVAYLGTVTDHGEWRYDNLQFHAGILLAVCLSCITRLA